MSAAKNNSPFYLGKVYDLEKRTLLDQQVLYDSADLTTHGIVVGMTGSGKTGLSIGLLEEAALNGIPAILVDPKGDLTNLLLHFPGMATADFLPWIEPEAARREGKTPEEMAAETASRWKQGLADWGIDSARIQALKDSAYYSVYTPGSNAGRQVSILASLQAPTIPWNENQEILREKISSTAIALLGLVGLNDIDPVRSREHILLANIFEQAWSQGRDLTLEELILQTQTPPFPKLGVFPVDSFYPAKERFELAMLLNNFLASPAFQIWMEGEALDIPTLLYTPDGTPRHTVFYLAHLNDTERMFFVTLLYSAVETWMRTQAGSSGLRALLYFDEILGYLPPMSNPPSKTIMLRMLKQARAFGVGLLLATQNPIDVDYKGLSNAGTWFVGKLQTDQDKQRLLDGLAGAAGGLDRGEYDRLISSLGKRIFLLHNVHESKPVIFQTRYTMNYLAGPLTRAQIPMVNRLSGEMPGSAAHPAAAEFRPPVGAVGVAPAGAPVEARPAGRPAEGSSTRPTLPAGVSEYFFPNNVTLNQALQENRVNMANPAAGASLIYRPVLLAQADVRYLQRKYDVDTTIKKTILVQNADRRGAVRWEDFPYPAVEGRSLESAPGVQARYAALDAPLTDSRLMADMQKDYLDWVYRSGELRLRSNEALKVYAGPEVGAGEFRDLCSKAAKEAADADVQKTTASFASRQRSLEDKLERLQRQLDVQEDRLSNRKTEEVGNLLETGFGFLTGRKRRLTSALTKRRMSSEAKSNVNETKQEIASLQADLKALEAEKIQAAAAVNDRWSRLVQQVDEIPLVPMKKDIFLDLFGVAWLPYYVVGSGDQAVEVPAFRAG